MKVVKGFITWYENRASGSNGKPFYKFDKIRGQGFKSKAEYIIFDKISSFEVDEVKLKLCMKRITELF